MKTILVVDDNEQNLYMLQMLLSRSGYEVVTASDGAEALQKANGEPPSIIISDILMPVMDGFALCRRWKADDQLRKIPFVFYTATYTDPKDEEFALSLGAERFIVKPQEPDVFLNLLQEVLNDATSGELQSPRDQETDESVLMREYNETLIRKLDRKLQQLSEANSDLRLESEQRSALVKKLETKNAELECYAYAVSHDLKAPLVTINGFLSELTKSIKAGHADRTSEAVGEIASAATTMGRLLDGLLESARLTNADEFDEEVPLDEVVREALNNLRQTIADRGANIEVNGDFPTVRGSRIRLLQLFQNLIDNATKFTVHESQPHIEIGVRRNDVRKNDGATICFVADNGIGIASEYANNVFGLFNQLDPSVEGVGIGLALAKRVVEAHGGRIWFESSGEGKGSTFCFTVTEAKTKG